MSFGGPPSATPVSSMVSGAMTALDQRFAAPDAKPGQPTAAAKRPSMVTAPDAAPSSPATDGGKFKTLLGS